MSIWPTDRNLSGATIPGQSGLGSNGNEEVLHILQSYNTWAWPLDCLVSGQGVLPLSRDAVGVFYKPNRLGTFPLEFSELVSNCN